MYSHKELQKLYSLLSEREELENVSIILAYPYSVIPAQLSKPVITLSPGGIRAEKSAIGQGFYVGEKGISIEVFVPRKLGTPCVYSIIETVADTAQSLGAKSITADKIKVNGDIECFSSECTVVFFGEISFAKDGD